MHHAQCVDAARAAERDSNTYSPVRYPRLELLVKGYVAMDYSLVEHLIQVDCQTRFQHPIVNRIITWIALQSYQKPGIMGCYEHDARTLSIRWHR